MVFEHKLSEAVKRWNINHSEPVMSPQMSHGDVAKTLARLYTRTNFGRRSRVTVFLFRKSEEFR
jgi:hypothetical protein